MSANARVRLAHDLHARPASAFVDAVQRTGSLVLFELADGSRLDAASVLTVMAADLREGSTVTVHVTDPRGTDRAARVLDDLCARLTMPADEA